MNMSALGRPAIAGATLFASLSTYAALVDNGSYTTDTTANRDWLDLSFTLGTSYNDVVLATSPGGSLEEWSIGTSLDVFEFFNNAGGDGSYSDTNNVILQITLYALWGQANHSGTNAPLDSWWHVEDVTPGGSTSGMLWWEDSYVYTYFDDFADPNDEYPGIATALYRQSVVPIPAAGWLFMSAILGLVGKKQLSRR